MRPLRAQAVGDLPAESPRGLAIVLASGSAGLDPGLGACRHRLVHRLFSQVSRPVVPRGLGAEVVRLLTEMALGSRRAGRHLMSTEARTTRSAPRTCARQAYLYVRQSTLRQVLENTESTKRQYALRERAVALGWKPEQVVVIDSDLGQSGADADRAGFQRLVAAVGMGEVGVVLGLEVSRLARSSSDWHRLLEICALADTLILDEDGLYDPTHFNDRLLLGMKGTMSEAELHVLRARLIGGQLAKARRGELESASARGSRL